MALRCPVEGSGRILCRPIECGILESWLGLRHGWAEVRRAVCPETGARLFPWEVGGGERAP